MGFCRLPESDEEPTPHEDQMITEEKDPDEETSAEDDRLDRMCVFSFEGERIRVLVMEFVDVTIDGFVMEDPMPDVMPEIFDHHAQETPGQDTVPGRHGIIIHREIEVGEEMIIEIDERGLDEELGCEDDFRDIQPILRAGGAVGLESILVRGRNELQDEWNEIQDLRQMEMMKRE